MIDFLKDPENNFPFPMKLMEKVLKEKLVNAQTVQYSHLTSKNNSKTVCLNPCKSISKYQPLKDKTK